jgi:hypothetical protein
MASKVLPLGTVLVLLVASIGTPAAPVSDVAAEAYRGEFWSVELATTYTKSTSGSLDQFDFGYVSVLADGTNHDSFMFADEIATNHLPPFGQPEGAAQYGLTTTGLTSVSVTCNLGPARYAGTVQSTESKASAGFNDGLNYFVYDALGTGYSKHAALLGATGDVKSRTPKDQAGLSVGDVPSELGGSVTATMFTFSYAPKVGEGEDEKALSYVDEVTAGPQRTLAFEFRTYSNVQWKGDDQGVGYTGTTASTTLHHTANVTGSGCMTDSTDSTLDLEIRNGKANLVIQYVDKASGEVVGTVEKHFFGPFATFEQLTGEDPREDEGFDGERRLWEFFDGTTSLDSADPSVRVDAPGNGVVQPDSTSNPSASFDSQTRSDGDVGLVRGDTGTYEMSVTDPQSPLWNVTGLRIEVLRVNETTGDALVLLSNENRDGTTSEDNLVVLNIFGESPLRGLVAPSNLSVGDTVFGSANVTDVGTRIVDGEQRTVVFVTDESGETSLVATYDQETGLPVFVEANAPEGDLSIRLVDLALAPTRDE